MANYSYFRLLSFFYFLVFLVVVFVIFLVHTIPTPFLDIVRLPTFLRLINPFLGYSWPTSLHIYQGILITFLLITIVDSASLLFSSSRKLRVISAISSYIGYTLMGIVSLFFIYSLLFFSYSDLTIKQASFFMGVTFLLLILDLFTFIIDEEGLIKLRGKRA